MSRFRLRPARAVIAGLTTVLLAVLGVDATAIVAAPDGDKSATTTHVPAALLPPAGLRVITWSGQRWLVLPEGAPGPEKGVKLTDSTKAVHVDSHGHLHLAVIKVDGRWRSVQLELLSPVSYGHYRFTVHGNIAKFSKVIVLGMFLYHPGAKFHTDEIDLEDSNFSGVDKRNNSQYVVQPYLNHPPAHWCTHRLDPALTHSVQEFTWKPGSVTFDTRSSASSSPLRLRCTAPGLARGGRDRSFTYRGKDVPTTSNNNALNVFINLWQDHDYAPKHGKHSITIDSFHFTPASG